MNISRLQTQAKKCYDSAILRLAASPVLDLRDAVEKLSTRFRRVDRHVFCDGQAFERRTETLEEDSTLSGAQEDYATVLDHFVKVTNRLRIPYTAAQSRLNKRNSTVS